MNPFQRKYTRLLTAKLFDRDIDLLSLRAISIQRKSAPALSLGSWLSFATLGLAGVTNPWLYLFPLVGSIGALFLDEESDRAAALLMPLITQRDEARRIGEKELLESQLVCLKEMLAGQEEWVRAQLSLPSQHLGLPPAQETASPTSDDEYLPNLFDWSLLRTKPQIYAHIAILAPTGGGKTVTGEWLADLIGQGHNVKVVTTKAKSSQWRGMEVVGTPRDFETIGEEVEQLKLEMIERMGNLDAVESMPQLVRVFDELAAMVANIDKFEIGTFIREARETGIRIIALIHGEQVKLIGLEGESDTAEGLTWVRLGKFAIKRAKKLVSQGELTPLDLEWLKKQERPCLVDDQLAIIPNLSSWQPHTAPTPTSHQPTPTSHQPTPTSHQLNALWHNSHQPTPAHTEIDPIDPFLPITPLVRGLVWGLARQGWSQTKIITTVWKCTKGGNNKAYLQAKELYSEIMEASQR